MAHRILCLLLVVVGVLMPTVLGVCDDIDSQACALMQQNDPNMCKNSGLSTVACPRFCNLCPLTCYHCDGAVQTFTDCNTTKECAVGEQCMLRELSSTADSHHEYAMSCESVQHCDGAGLTFAFGRRDVHSRNVAVSCCSSDLCNTPTVKPPVTTVAPSSGCRRDILILVEDSHTQVLSGWSGSSHVTTHVKNLLSALVKGSDIGPQATQMEVALIDSAVHKQWDLDQYSTATDLLKAIDGLQLRHRTDNLDVNDLTSFIKSVAFKPRNGDRPGVPNDIIVIVDHRADINGHVSYFDHHELNQLSGDIIIVNVGGWWSYAHSGSTSRPTTSAMSSLATDSNHALHVSGYDMLYTITDELLALICD